MPVDSSQHIIGLEGEQLGVAFAMAALDLCQRDRDQWLNDTRPYQPFQS